MKLILTLLFVNLFASQVFALTPFSVNVGGQHPFFIIFLFGSLFAIFYVFFIRFFRQRASTKKSEKA